MTILLFEACQGPASSPSQNSLQYNSVGEAPALAPRVLEANRMKQVVAAVALLTWSVTAAQADTETTNVDTLVVVTPNAPVVVTPNGASQPMLQPPGMPPAAPMAANGAPQNEDWNNVSHINGVPIKVGERGDYLVKQKKTNLAANPFGLFFGMYDLSVTHAVAQNVALSAAITAVDGEFFQVSATVPLYFRRAFSGPFLEGGLLYRTNLQSETSFAGCVDCGSDNSWVGPQLMLGWQWTFDSGLNLAFAAGVAKRMTSKNEYGDDTEGNAYFRVGYAF